MGFWVWLLVDVIINVAQVLIGAASRKRPEDPQPSSLGSFNIPTADETRPIPVIWGTCLIRSPNVVWYGDFSTSAFYNQGNLAGYYYLFGIHWMLCHGKLDQIIGVWLDGRPYPSFTTTDFGTYKRFNFYNPNLTSPPGTDVPYLNGDIDIYYGDDTQVANDYLVAQVGNLPAYRGVASAVARKVTFGTSNYLRAIAFEVRRCPNPLGLTGGKENINGDANAACMLYEILTNTKWGLGRSSGEINITSYAVAADTLYTEGLGLSMQLDTQMTAAELIGEIERHIDAVSYTDPQTGLLTLKLIRNDYVFDDLPVLNNSNVIECKISRASWENTSNAVRVTYVDRANDYTERIASAMDLANVQARSGEIAAEEVAFRGISTALNAQRAAARELRPFAMPPLSMEITANRTAWALRPGDAFRLTREPYGITDLVCRVRKPRDGTLTDGKIHFDAVENVFVVNWTAYTPIPHTVWVDHVRTPTALLAQRLEEAPYALAGGAHRRVITLGVRGSTVVFGYKVWVDPAGGTNYGFATDVAALTPSATLNAGVTPASSSLVVAGGVDMERLATISAASFAAGGNLLLVDNELIAWLTIVNNGDGTYTLSGLQRGVADTTPKAHSTSARVYFLTAGYGFSSTADYATDLTLTGKFLPYNSVGVLAIAAATQISVVTNDRASRPYVPTAIKENTLSYPTNIADDLVVAWSHRNRLGAWDYSNAGVTAGLEAGTAYRVKVYGETGTLIHTESGLTGTSWTYTRATEISESGGLGRPNGTLRVTVESYQTGGAALVSQQMYDHTCDAAGWDMLYGDYYGGVAG